MNDVAATAHDPDTDDQTETSDPAEHADAERHKDLLGLATERFQQAYQAHKDDFTFCSTVQEFLSGDQWPEGIKNDREQLGRPCLTLDHLNQYVRHVINSGLMRERDIRVLAMSGEADDEVASVLAGLIRQITQTSSAKVAYETGLRHTCSVGFGYWRAKVELVPGTKTAEKPDGLMEISIRKIKEPRMVLMDPFCDYPDGRDAKYAFVLSKLTTREFDTQYPEAEGCKSWHTLDTNETLPWIDGDPIVVAEYYYYEGETLRWAILCPDKVLTEGVHHGNVMPIVRVVGEEYEVSGKERRRGMVNNSSMDAQRAYNYSSSAFIEAVALAPLAPYIVAAGQIEQFQKEWGDAHKTPRPALRYTPVSIGGQMAPPPQRSLPAGIPDGWQGMMANLIQDTQMIMGLAQPNVLGTGGIPVQSGVGIEAQKEPGDVNTFHFIEHWHGAIEQTGRVILAMIPHVYTEPQAVKIVGDDGVLETALLDPTQTQTIAKEIGRNAQGYEKVLSTSYNPLIGRYDVAIATGPASATKKSEASKLMMAMVQADPTLMQKAGDLVVGTMDMSGADVLAKRLKAFLPPGLSEDDEAAQMQMLHKFGQENQQLKQQLQELQQIIMGEREQNQAKIVEIQMQAKADVLLSQQKGHAELVNQQVSDDSKLRIATMQAHVDLETNTQNNIVKVILERIKSQSKIDVETLKQFSEASQAPTFDERMGGYGSVLESLSQHAPPPAVPLVIAAPPPAAPAERPSPRGWQIVRDAEGNLSHLIPMEEPSLA